MTSRLETVIETPRLILKVPSLKEFEPWCAFMADEEAAQYIGKAQPASVVWRNICSMAGSWQLQGFAMFSVFEKSTGRWVGRVGPWRPHQWPGNEVGWGVIRQVWGKGYAFEAALASMDFAVDVLRWDDIIHSIHPNNVASQKLAKRLGSINRGPGKMPPPYENDPVDLWGQTRDEWRARRDDIWASLLAR
ncbi:MAG TPA: GNAT family N-acetyltransferase [Hyphomonadaceae bacterium]|jgi:RimJ/RimL family protein N-acetyltransferase|nr:GNAT family N-acetyltransferase [Hyphomonadaceae bacterium]HPI50076.1 GNAT family N-acetyltransferase [Hyphomonadaceae bacterium]